MLLVGSLTFVLLKESKRYVNLAYSALSEADLQL
jgi:hypothetical protein